MKVSLAVMIIIMHFIAAKGDSDNRYMVSGNSAGLYYTDKDKEDSMKRLRTEEKKEDSYRPYN